MANMATPPSFVVVSRRASRRVLMGSIIAVGAFVIGRHAAAELQPRIEVEEEVYQFVPANNGAGPMWCHGNTSIVRSGDRVFASGLETIPGAKPLNNCLPTLFFRNSDRWVRIYQGEGRTREPSPLAMFPGGQVLMSINPTLTQPDTHSGPARPQVLQFDAAAPETAPLALTPTWEGQPKFTEHSYRSFAADGESKELVLFQNIGYTHAAWSFQDHDGNWSATGKLTWPASKKYEKQQPIRICYPNVALHNRAVYFCGVSDIIEPYQAWREAKFQLTGRKWDYDFRRLFFTWCADITTGQFSPWLEVASHDKTGGWIFPCDLHVAPNGDVLILWQERALDERLREKFFPDAKQRYALMCGRVRDGEVISQTTLVEGGEGLGGLRPGNGRFHRTAKDQLLAIFYVGGKDTMGQPVAEHRIVELGPDGSASQPVTVRLETPLPSFFIATERAGCQPTDVLDLFGISGSTMRYARIRLLSHSHQ